MITSPVSELRTSSGIFSPRRTLESASVRSSRNLSVWARCSSFIFLVRRRMSLVEIFSLSRSLLVVVFTSIIMPFTPDGTTSDVSFTSAAFSPNIARNSFSSGASSVSDFGVILPTRMSPGLTSAPTRITPLRSRFLRASSPTLGMSRVISSGPSFVSRAVTSYSSI